VRVGIFVNAAKACTLSTSVRVDNARPRLRSWKLVRVGHRWRVTVRTSEAASVYVWARHTRLRLFHVRGGKTVSVLLRSTRKPTEIVLRDRAGNLVLTKLAKKT
jgi:hypothetical protein